MGKQDEFPTGEKIKTSPEKSETGGVNVSLEITEDMRKLPELIRGNIVKGLNELQQKISEVPFEDPHQRDGLLQMFNKLRSVAAFEELSVKQIELEK